MMFLQKRADKQRHLCFFLGIHLIIGVDLEIIALVVQNMYIVVATWNY